MKKLKKPTRDITKYTECVEKIISEKFGGVLTEVEHSYNKASGDYFYMDTDVEFIRWNFECYGRGEIIKGTFYFSENEYTQLGNGDGILCFTLGDIDSRIIHLPWITKSDVSTFKIYLDIISGNKYFDENYKNMYKISKNKNINK